MRSSTEIQGRIKHLLSRELDRRVAEATKRLPHKCEHNYRHPLDVRKTVDGEPNPSFNKITLPVAQTIGLCMLGSEDPETWGGTICEDPVDAQRCPYFSARESKDEILLTLRKDSQDSEWLQANLPEVYGLLWALQDRPPKLPWWKVLWFRLLRIRVEPLTPSPEVERLLPPPNDDSLGV